MIRALKVNINFITAQPSTLTASFKFSAINSCWPCQRIFGCLPGHHRHHQHLKYRSYPRPTGMETCCWMEPSHGRETTYRSTGEGSRLIKRMDSLYIGVCERADIFIPCYFVADSNWSLRKIEHFPKRPQVKWITHLSTTESKAMYSGVFSMCALINFASPTVPVKWVCYHLFEPLSSNNHPQVFSQLQGILINSVS